MYILQGSICENKTNTKATADQQQKNPPLTIAPTSVPLPPPTYGAKGWSVAPSAPGMIRNPIAPGRGPSPAPALPIAYNLPNIVGYRFAPAAATVGPQQNLASAVKQSAMAPVNPNPTKNLPSALPRVMRTVECSVCRTKTQTDAYTYVDCSNPDCRRRICLLDNCLQSLLDITQHQRNQHFKSANPFQCLSCKAPKSRGIPKVNYAQCPVCGVTWCLVGNCTFETRLNVIYQHISHKHQISE